MLFASSHKKPKVGISIDLGSASAAVSLLALETDATSPRILWSKREDAPVKGSAGTEAATKLVVTALMNLLLEFETAGRQTLREYNNSAKITTVQCKVAAPWTHTVTKKIVYKQDEDFEVSEEMIKELVKTAITKAEEDLQEESSINEHGLTIASRATIHTLLNGYRTQYPIGQMASELVLLHTTVAIHQPIKEAIEELHEKMFPAATLEIFSNVLASHCVASQTAPQHSNMALLDMTHEATELSIIRDGELSQSTFAQYGLYSIARSLGEAFNIPLVEALGYLKSDHATLRKNFSKTEEAKFDSVIEEFIEKNMTLFDDTGDELALPRQIVLNVEVPYEGFVADLLDMSAKRLVKTEPVIVKANTTLFKQLHKEDKVNIADTSILIGAYFFHTGNQCITIDHK